jgi:hypothetical protein
MKKIKINIISFLGAFISYWILATIAFKLTNTINLNPIVWLISVIIVFGIPWLIFREIQKRLLAKYYDTNEVNKKRSNLVYILFLLLVPGLNLVHSLIINHKYKTSNSTISTSIDCISGNCIDGQGTFNHNGNKYMGEFKNAEFNGHGTWSYKGNTYIGEFKNSEFNGQGTMILSDGSKYIGEFKNDKYEGRGTLTDANGKIKSGIWKNDKFIHP